MYPNLRAELARRNMSVAELADAMGCVPSAVYKKLNGETDFKLREAKAVKEALGYWGSLDELFERVGNDTKSAG